MSYQNRFSSSFFLYYLLAVVGSLSTAGASMTILALSANFYMVDQAGVTSSSIYVLYYLGIAIMGFVGGWILQRFTAVTLGIMSVLVSGVIVFYLACLPYIPPSIGLSAIFFIFLLDGISHPNSLRFFNEVIPEREKMAFFSIKEGAVYVFGLITPALAACIIKTWGTKVCFLIDGGTYILSCLPWLILKNKHIQFASIIPTNKPDWFIGFKLLIKDQNIRALNISRLLNNLAYITWLSVLPLLLAKIAQGDVDLFALEQGTSIHC